jgi:hypothetical protein
VFFEKVLTSQKDVGVAMKTKTATTHDGQTKSVFSSQFHDLLRWLLDICILQARPFTGRIGLNRIVGHYLSPYGVQKSSAQSMSAVGNDDCPADRGVRFLPLDSHLPLPTIQIGLLTLGIDRISER